MTAHLPVLIVVVPLGTAFVVPLVTRLSVPLARTLVLAALVGITVCASASLSRVLSDGNWHYELGGWAPPWGIEYVITSVSAGMALLIGCIALLVAVYASPHLSGWPSGRTGVFYSLFLLLVSGLLGIVVTGDLFNLYVFLEIASLAAYALLASGGIHATVATFRYLIVGTIAATFYLLGIGYLYALTGSLNMADLAARLPAVMDSRVFVVAVSFIVVGLALKTAVFPLHGWLPDTYTFAPAPVIGLVSAVMAKVGAFALFRILYFVLHTEGAASRVLIPLGWASAIAVVAGSVLAVAQRDIRRMLAYSSVGQMGYIALGLAIGNATALTGVLLHILNHAIMKGCLFLIAGGIQWRTGVCHIEAFVGMSRRMPLTMAAFAVAALSMIGLPPTAGFFSKWYLISGALEAQAWVYVVALVLSSLLTAVYFFRVIEVAHLRQPHAADAASQQPAARQELPAPMLTPIVVLATAVLVLGLLSHPVVTRIIQVALPQQVL
ncbi:Na(+)/H(+) antiporter subunit D [Candidatus Entotheonellaceae bacterium PAL068K]